MRRHRYYSLLHYTSLCSLVVSFQPSTRTSPNYPLLIFRNDSSGVSSSAQRTKNLRFVRQSTRLQSTNEDETTTTTTTTPFDDYLDQAQLQKAANYLKLHPETKLSRTQFAKVFDAVEQCTGEDVGNSQQQQQQRKESSRQEMAAMYQQLQQRHDLQLFGAAPVETLAPTGTSHNLPSHLLEEILQLPLSSLTPQPSNSLFMGGIVLVLQLVVSTVWQINLNTTVALTLALALLDRVFLNGAVLESMLKIASPGVQQRILKHEAGHFLVAYLMGCPVEGVVVSAWGALRDRRFGNRQVSAGTSFYDPQLLSTQSTGRVTRNTIDRYCIIVMAGIAAEADQFGRADGGAGDEAALVTFLSQLSGSWDTATIKNQARWGALQAVLLLREYRPAYEALVDALERGGSLGDCIYAIEKAARDHNLKPLREPVGYLIEEKDGTASWKTARDEAAEQESRKELAATESSGTLSAVVDPDESLATLQEYERTIEQRLKELNQELDKLQ